MPDVSSLSTDRPEVQADATRANGVSNGNVPVSSFKIHETPVENLRPIKIVVIGAGYSGIYCGIRIPERLRNAELVIYEKNAGVGGTWYENRYLGCACDIPSHSYQYSFEPNKSWSSLYAPAAEIQAYLEMVATKYSATRFIKLQHEIIACHWEDKTAKWHVEVKNLATGETIHDSADVLISGRGNLNTPSWPEIEGLDTFKGEVMHSARWNESYDFANKRVGVIGSGSSSIQIVPSLQRLPGTQVSTFVRSKTWISPPFGQALWDKYNFGGTTIPAELRELFAKDSKAYEEFRLSIEEDGNAAHGVTIKGTPQQTGAKDAFIEHMKLRLASKPEIFDALVPSFSPGCRRLTPGPGYLEALTQPNVSFITAPITRISETAIHTADNVTHTIDTLVCATGFKATVAPPFPVTGSNGLALKDKWGKRATAYLSLSISSFPNHFTMLGPNSAIGSGSLTVMLENVGDYIIKCVRKMQKENIAAMTVKEDREQDFVEYVDSYFKGTVFADECRSWYKNHGTGEVVGLWPGSTLHCVEALRSPRWEDFEYVYVGDLEGEGGSAGSGAKTNQMAWLGNGWSINQMEKKHLAWYLYPEFLDRPVASRPEEKGKYQVRPFSH